VSSADVNASHAQELALQASADGMIPLKCGGTVNLSMKKDPSTAMIGFWAEHQSNLQEDYHGRAPFLHFPAHAACDMRLDINVATGPMFQDKIPFGDWTTNTLEATQAPTAWCTLELSIDPSLAKPLTGHTLMEPLLRLLFS
jgi:xylan 1,4-beta-xylosidase